MKFQTTILIAFCVLILIAFLIRDIPQKKLDVLVEASSEYIEETVKEAPKHDPKYEIKLNHAPPIMWAHTFLDGSAGRGFITTDGFEFRVHKGEIDHWEETDTLTWSEHEDGLLWIVNHETGDAITADFVPVAHIIEEDTYVTIDEDTLELIPAAPATPIDSDG